MSEDPTGEIENKPSHDVNAESSTAPEAEVKTGEESSQAEASATEKTDEPKEKATGYQKRINQLTREKYERQQENADLKARLDKLEAKPEAAKAPDIVAPNEDDFDTHGEYQAAHTKFVSDTASNAAYDRITAENASSAEVTKQNERQEAVKVKKAAFEKNLDEKRANFEDFEDVAYGHQFMDLDLAEQIFEMDKGPEVAYHLGSHLDEAARIFALQPVQRARELTKLEFQVEALAPKKVSDAPDPLNPLGNNEKVDVNGKDGENLTTDEWQAWRNQQVHG